MLLFLVNISKKITETVKKYLKQQTFAQPIHTASDKDLNLNRWLLYNW
jgi:hypothetical protein